MQKKIDPRSKKINGIMTLDSGLPHASNIRRKIETAKTKEQKKALSIVVPAYERFHASMNFENKESIKKSIHEMDIYLNTLRQENCKVFAHQSDFISTVVPEFYYRLFASIIKKEKLSFQVQAQKDIIIDCTFDPYDSGRINFGKKRVDVIIILPVPLTFKNIPQKDFFIPVVAMEVKTNIDKNMLSGIESSVESLKKTFPRCHYFAIAEFADFAVEHQNYAITFIDEIYVLRKQKRSHYLIQNHSQRRFEPMAKKKTTYEKDVDALVNSRVANSSKAAKKRYKELGWK